MTANHGIRGVHVSSGEGIVAHLSNLTAFANGEETRLNELLVRLNALANAPWHEIVRTLTASIADADFEGHPNLACVSIDDDRVAALVFGDTTLSITIEGSETILNGRDSNTWIDVALHGAVEQIHAGRQSESIVVGVLRDGVIPAGGFLYNTAGPMPASGRWAELAATTASTPPPMPSPEVISRPETPAPEGPAPAPAEDKATSGSLAGMFARIDQRYRRDNSAAPLPLPEAPAPTQAPDSPPGSPTPPTSGQPPARPDAGTLAPARPQLRGVLCPAGHLTRTGDSACRTCGIATDPDAETVMGDRPVLGVLTFDDGAVLPVDRPAAIGSDIPSGYEIDGSPATAVRLDDGSGGVSAVQVEIRTVGWDVELHDMNSENGTYTILLEHRQTRTRLRAGQSVLLQQNMMVEVGGRRFTYTVGSATSPSAG